MIDTHVTEAVSRFRLAERAPLYIRVIVTEQCNNACAYCFGENCQGKDIGLFGMDFFEELSRIAKTKQIPKIHFTGGEPLVEGRIADYVKQVAGNSGIDVGLTTNGTLLRAHARKLRAAGLKRINISLPSLRANRYRVICGNDMLEVVLSNIDLALDAGFNPVKINVPIYDGNIDEMFDFMRYFLGRERVLLRFFSILPNDGMPKTQRLSSEQMMANLGESIARLPLELKEEATRRVYFRGPFEPALSICAMCPRRHACQDQAKALRISRDGSIRLCLENPRYTVRIGGIADLYEGVSRLLRLYYS